MRLVVLVCVGACGRINFDAADDGGGGGGEVSNAPVACKGTETTGPATSTFDNGATWANVFSDAGAFATLTNNRLRAVPAQTSGSSAGVGGGGARPEAGRRLFVQVPRVPATDTCARAELVIVTPDGDSRLSVAAACGQLEAERSLDGALTTLAQTAYDPIDHAWWQLRIEQGVGYFETSRDGENWTMFGQYIGANGFFVGSGVGTIVETRRAETNPVGEALFDNMGDCIIHP